MHIEPHMHSTTTRLRTAFVPWLAALVIGATAHAGWLIHDLRDHRGTEPPQSFTHTIVEFDDFFVVTLSNPSPGLALGTASARRNTATACSDWNGLSR